MLNHIDKDRIDRYIRNKTDMNENTRMEIIFSNGHDDPGLYEYMKKDWDNAPADYTDLKPELYHVLDHIYQLIRIRENLEKHLSAPAIYSIASILILPLLILGDDQSPFLISTGNSLEKVHGTNFNVCAYQKNQYTKIILRQAKLNSTLAPLDAGFRPVSAERMAPLTRRWLPYTRKQCKP